MGIFGDTAPMVIAGFFITMVNLIFHVIGFATPYWYKMDSVHFGLWQTCGPSGLPGREFVICINFNEAPATSLPTALKAAQALECIALIAFLAAVVMGVLKVFVMKDNGGVYIISSIINFGAGFLGIIAAIVFTTTSIGDNSLTSLSSSLNFSFAFCIIAACGGVINGVIFILAWRWVHLHH